MGASFHQRQRRYRATPVNLLVTREHHHDGGYAGSGEILKFWNSFYELIKEMMLQLTVISEAKFF